MNTINSNIILDKTMEFSLQIIDALNKSDLMKCDEIRKQLTRSSLSIGSNVKEAQNPESIADFIHKMKIALKEAEETEYWLQICHAQQLIPECNEFLNKLRVIIKILAKIISTSKKRLKKSNSNRKF
ncbi:MAG: four helix bundle protein [Bacteroidales bacterium]